ncbi:MAG: tRNA-dihydrouridine synthase [Clostridia bacterium]|nr:tRNA-dihydrouridine synthase [Clostridia bacterium]
MQAKGLKIAGLETDGNIFLAPLAGYTNAVFRKLCADIGASVTYTEMVSAKGLFYDSQKTRDLLRIADGCKGIRGCQIFGSDPDCMREAACSEDLAPFDLIDINMGCPVPKIYRNGEGSALMNDLPLASRIISEVKKSGKTVSVKFRTGPNPHTINCSEFACMCEDSGADVITIHGRVRDAMYSGPVNYEAIADAKAKVHIPVIANGGIFTEEDADSMLAQTGADGIMVARGAMFNPWIFSVLSGKGEPSSEDKQAFVLRQLDETEAMYGERFTCVYMRKMVSFYTKGMPGAARLRTELLQTPTCKELRERVQDIEF